MATLLCSRPCTFIAPYACSAQSKKEGRSNWIQQAQKGSKGSGASITLFKSKTKSRIPMALEITAKEGELPCNKAPRKAYRPIA